MIVTLQFDTNNPHEKATLAAILSPKPVLAPEVFVGDAMTSSGGTTTVAKLPGSISVALDGAPGSLAHAAKQAAFSLDDAVEATKGLANAKGLGAATALLAAFQVERVSDLAAEERADYITQAAAAKAAV
jgi:hypothetical protein